MGAGERVKGQHGLKWKCFLNIPDRNSLRQELMPCLLLQEILPLSQVAVSWVHLSWGQTSLAALASSLPHSTLLPPKITETHLKQHTANTSAAQCKHAYTEYNSQRLEEFSLVLYSSSTFHLRLEATARQSFTSLTYVHLWPSPVHPLLHTSVFFFIIHRSVGIHTKLNVP